MQLCLLSKGRHAGPAPPAAYESAVLAMTGQYFRVPVVRCHVYGGADSNSGISGYWRSVVIAGIFGILHQHTV
ncbi:hypothetical protein B0J17DRAFT_666063 [Rhizoctonia solani]|nr:hypothetical protein B0J17DRAFT_666063 [Rhizoctonia solani]